MIFQVLLQMHVIYRQEMNGSSGHYKCASFYFIFLTLCLKPLPPFIFIVAYVRIVFINVRLARALFYGIKER